MNVGIMCCASLFILDSLEKSCAELRREKRCQNLLIFFFF